MKEIPKNCRECGSELNHYRVYASEIEVYHYDSQGGSFFRLDSPFNEKTGGRNIADDYRCPNWKKRFFLGSNEHDRVIVYENDLHYL